MTIIPPEVLANAEYVGQKSWVSFSEHDFPSNLTPSLLVQ